MLSCVVWNEMRDVPAMSCTPSSAAKGSHPAGQTRSHGGVMVKFGFQIDDIDPFSCKYNPNISWDKLTLNHNVLLYLKFKWN